MSFIQIYLDLRRSWFKKKSNVNRNDVNRISYCSSMFLTRNLKYSYELTVIPQFTPQLVPKKGNVNRITTKIQVTGNKKLDDVNRNNFNRGDVNGRTTV